MVKLLPFLTISVASAAVVPKTIESRDTCNIAEAAPLLFIGGSGGDSFCDSRWPDTNAIQKLISFSKGVVMTGLQVTYANGDIVMHGTAGDATMSGALGLSDGETITAASLCGDGNGDRLGAIYIETSGGAKVKLGESTAKEYKLNNLGKRNLIGITGRQGNEINSLALIFEAA